MSSGAAYGREADLYSLGVVIYEMLQSQLPLFVAAASAREGVEGKFEGGSGEGQGEGVEKKALSFPHQISAEAMDLICGVIVFF